MDWCHLYQSILTGTEIIPPPVLNLTFLTMSPHIYIWQDKSYIIFYITTNNKTVIYLHYETLHKGIMSFTCIVLYQYSQFTEFITGRSHRWHCLKNIKWNIHIMDNVSLIFHAYGFEIHKWEWFKWVTLSDLKCTLHSWEKNCHIRSKTSNASCVGLYRRVPAQRHQPGVPAE